MVLTRIFNSYIEQLSLILQTLGVPDEETLARIGSDKVGLRASNGRIGN